MQTKLTTEHMENTESISNEIRDRGNGISESEGKAARVAVTNLSTMEFETVGSFPAFLLSSEIN